MVVGAGRLRLPVVPFSEADTEVTVTGNIPLRIDVVGRRNELTVKPERLTGKGGACGPVARSDSPLDEVPCPVKQAGKPGIRPDNPGSTIVVPHLNLKKTRAVPRHGEQKSPIQIPAPVIHTVFTPQLDQRPSPVGRQNLVEAAPEADRKVIFRIDRITVVHRPEAGLVDLEFNRFTLLRDLEAARASRPAKIEEVPSGSAVDQRRAVVEEEIGTVVELQHHPVRRIHRSHRVAGHHRIARVLRSDRGDRRHQTVDVQILHPLDQVFQVPHRLQQCGQTVQHIRDRFSYTVIHLLNPLSQLLQLLEKFVAYLGKHPDGVGVVLPVLQPRGEVHRLLQRFKQLQSGAVLLHLRQHTARREHHISRRQVRHPADQQVVPLRRSIEHHRMGLRMVLKPVHNHHLVQPHLQLRPGAVKRKGQGKHRHRVVPPRHIQRMTVPLRVVQPEVIQGIIMCRHSVLLLFLLCPLAPYMVDSFKG